MKAIVAVDEGMGIGYEGGMPWPYNRDDMRHFQKMTRDQVVIMGRKTWESLPKRPLPDRRNIVITHDRDYVADGATVRHFFPEIPEAWVIGGAEIYREALRLHLLTRVVMTRIPGRYPADVHWPSGYHHWMSKVGTCQAGDLVVDEFAVHYPAE